MPANVDSVPTLDENHHLKAKHLDVPAGALIATPTSAMALAVQALITAAVSAIVDGAPGALNTLRELAIAIGSDPNYAADLATQLAGKATPADIAAAIAAQAASDRATYSPLVTTQQAQQVSTSSDLTTRLLAPLTPAPFAATKAVTAGDIVVDPSERYQQIHGLGAALTDSSAYVLTQYLTAAQRTAILTELFSPAQGNLGAVRISIGGSDFSSVPGFTYDDMPSGQTDPTLSNFSIAPDAARVIPVLREILAINPAVRIFASVWYAPGWMLTTPSAAFTGSQILDVTNNATVYANYLVKSIQAFRSYGIPIYAISPVNEPNSGAFRLNAGNQQTLIKTLGPALDAAGLDTKITAHDDQWTQLTNCLGVLSDTTTLGYVGGVAWHGYDGAARTAQGAIKRTYPNLPQYLTEYRSLQSETPTAIRGEMTGYVIDGFRNWANGIMVWNLALDQNGNPVIGSTGRNGVIAVKNDSSGTITRNTEYYVLTHVARFLKPGAVRIASTTYGLPYYQSYYDTPPDTLAAEVHTVAFRNPDGTIVLFAYNGDTAARSFQISESGKSFPVTLPAGEMATFVWGTTASPVPASTATPPAAVGAGSFTITGGNGQATLTWTAPTSGAIVGAYRLYRGTSAGNETTLVTTLPAATTGYTDYGLAAGTYSYVLHTVTTSGTVQSSSTSATVAAGGPPNAPTLSSSASTISAIVLTVTPPTTNGSPITGYSVLRGTSSGSETNYGTIPKGSTSFTDPSVASGTTYYYKVLANSSAGTSAASNEVTAAIFNVAQDAVSTASTNATTASSLTWSHTVGTGLGKSMLLVAVACSPTVGGTNTPRVSGVTFAGQALTHLGTPVDAYPDGTNRVIDLWYLIAPAAGAGSVVITAGSATDITASATSFSGVNQTTPFRTPVYAGYGAAGGAANPTSTAAPSATTTGGASGDLVFAAAALRATAPTAAAGQTQTFELANGRSANATLVGSTQPGSVANVVSTFNFNATASCSSVAAVAIRQ